MRRWPPTSSSHGHHGVGHDLGLALPGRRAGRPRWIVFPLVRGIGVVSSIVGTYAVSWWRTGETFKAMDLSYDLSCRLDGELRLLAFFVHDARVLQHRRRCPLLSASTSTPATSLTDWYSISRLRQHGRSHSAAAWFGRGMKLGVGADHHRPHHRASIIIYGGDPKAHLHPLRCGSGRYRHADPHRQQRLHGRVRAYLDNARVSLDMADLDPGLAVMTELDAVGNTTKLSPESPLRPRCLPLSPCSVPSSSTRPSSGGWSPVTLRPSGQRIDIADPRVFVGLLLGGALPFLYSSLAIWPWVGRPMW